MPKKKRKRESEAEKAASPSPAATPHERLAPFVVRDLTALAERAELSRAHGVEPIVRRLEALLRAGRTPVVVGDHGVGKTAIVEELARRAALGIGPLAESRIVEVPLARIVRGTKDRSELGRRLDELEGALVDEPRAVPYFPDLDVVWDADLESNLESMLLRAGRPFLAEADLVRIEWMLEYRPSLERHLAVARIAEPSLDQARNVATAWAAERRLAGGEPCVTLDALELLLDVAHRFLVRDRLPRSVVEPLSELVAVAGGARPVDVGDVVARMTEGLGLPRDLVDPRVRLDLGELRARLRREVLGQHDAVDALVDAVGLAKAGLADPDRPLGVFLFTGPTGVGKTQLVRSLARSFGDAVDRVARLNMADYRDSDAADLLFGSPTANTVSNRRGILTRRVTAQSFGLLLLDEFEKASEAVHDRFMQLFDEGVFLNGEGETVSCRALVIVATSNAGTDVWRTVGFDVRPAPGGVHRTELRRALDGSLEEYFRLELLKRFDRIVHFAPLARESVRCIARRELEALGRRAGVVRRALSLEVTDDLVDFVAREGFDPDLGVRPLRRIVERRVAPELARAIVECRDRPGAGRPRAVRLDADDGAAPGREVTAEVLWQSAPRLVGG